MEHSSASTRNLDPSAEEFHPTPHQNPEFINPPTFFPHLTPLPPPPQQVFIQYPPQFFPPPAAYFHVPPPPDTPQHLPSQPPTTTGAPSRSLLITCVPPHVSGDILKAEMEVFGEVRAVEMERAYEGIATVHFYDLRDSMAAMREIRAQHIRHQSMLTAAPITPLFPAPGLIAGYPVYAQFVIPAELRSLPDGLNHGTIVVFNLDSDTPAPTLKRIFEAFGPVKEVRETPSKRHQKFLEFFDVRDAARAAREMNGKTIHRKQITIDFSRPGGHGRRWFDKNQTTSDCFNQSKLRQQQQTAAWQSSRKPTRNNDCTSPENNDFPAASSTAPRSHPCQARRPTTTTNDNINAGDSMSSSGSVCKSIVAGRQNDAVLSSCAGVKVAVNRLRAVRNRSKGLDTRFMIKEDEITDCGGDSRTTVMIKNIPNKYSQKLFLSMLDNHCAHCNDQILGGDGVSDEACLSAYDFVYLPMDFNNKCNVGYGFVNMTSPEATVRLYKAFHMQSWEVFNSRKICEVSYARVQGLKALKEHFRNSKFPSGSDEIFPVVFEPPRDGRGQLTPPKPIYGLAASSESGSSSCRSSNEQQFNDSEGCGDYEVKELISDLSLTLPMDQKSVEVEEAVDTE